MSGGIFDYKEEFRRALEIAREEAEIKQKHHKITHDNETVLISGETVTNDDSCCDFCCIQ